MRTAIKVAILLFIPFHFFSPALAKAEEPAPATGRRMVVGGSASVTVRPDAARLTFAVTTSAPVEKNVREENDKQVKKIRDSIEELRYKNVETSTVPSSISTIQAPAPNLDGSPRIQARQVQTLCIVTVRERNEEKLRDMIIKLADVVAENGGVAPAGDDGIGFSRRAFAQRLGVAEMETVPGPTIEWLNEHGNTARREAIKKAVEDALANAQAAAGNAKITIHEISVPTAYSGEDFSLRLRRRADALTGESMQIPIRVNVQVTCSY